MNSYSNGRNNRINFIVNNKLIEYNLLTKKRKILLSSKYYIFKYLVVDNDIIASVCENFKESHICCCDRKIYWNGIKLEIQNILDRLCFDDFTLLNIGGHKYLTYRYSYNLYGLGKTFKLMSVVRCFTSSSCGRKIVFVNDYDQLYIQDVFNISIDQLFNIKYSRQIQSTWIIDVMKWIPNSNCIIINFNTLINLESQHVIKLKYCVFTSYLMQSRDLLQMYLRNLIIYDLNSGHRRQVKSDTSFEIYHRCLDILITDKLEYFRIQKHNNLIELEKVIFKCNYIYDRSFIGPKLQLIMDVLLLVLDLPYEIICVELFYCLLDYVDV